MKEISKSVYQEIRVEFKIYINHTTKKTLQSSFTKEIEFFEDTTKKEIMEDLKKLSKQYAGTNFICHYKILKIRKKEVERELKGKNFKRVKESFL